MPKSRCMLLSLRNQDAANNFENQAKQWNPLSCYPMKDTTSMKKSYLLFLLLIGLASCSSSQSLFELEPAQSMSITGKGPGQDAAYNPYGAGNSLAMVENLGDHPFVVRVQEQGKIIEETPIQPDERKEITLMKGYELYLDSELEGKAKVEFQELEK